jgi:hypothetical protein
MKSLLKIILKTKNEDFLLESWIKYYINLVGAENIIILDHNSDLPVVLDLYKKYKINVTQIPSHWPTPDWVHTVWVRQNKEFLKDTCYFYTILDSDEFLCFFDYEKNCIDNSKLLPFLLKNKEEPGFTSTWFYNHYYGEDYERIEDVTDFNFDIIKHNAICGKGIVNSNLNVKNVGHNKCVIGSIGDENVKVKCCPEFYLLHLQRVNYEHRFKNMINWFKAAYDMKFNTLEELFEILKNKDIKTLDFRERFVYLYILDTKNFAKNYRTLSPYPCTTPSFRTNLLKNFIENQEYTTEFLNTEIKDKKTFITSFFKDLNVEIN